MKKLLIIVSLFMTSILGFSNVKSLDVDVTEGAKLPNFEFITDVDYVGEIWNEEGRPAKPDSKVYIFDEPFNGLDITSVYRVKKLLQKLSKQHIVFIASHILETLQECEQLFLLQEGDVLCFASSELNEVEAALKD